ncbi:MAG: helix-turn-helix domain-containing protein [Bacteroidota bacterium]
MSQIPDIQKTLFDQIRDRLPAQASFVHEIAEQLSISYDSAYRRIRGEKALDVTDLYKLATAYNISLDALANLSGNKILFDYFTLEPDKLGLKEWLGLILADTRRINEAQEKEIIYAAKDPPIFHHFQMPELAAFKMFVWQKTLCQFPEFVDKKFCLADTDTEIMNMGRQLLSLSNKIPTTEIWNEDTFNITLRQMEYYRVSGYFQKEDDVLNLCDKLEKWIQHIKKQAECGFKFMYGEPAEGFENTFKLYENEVVLNDNSILVRRDDVTTVYLTFNTLSLLITQSPLFCENINNYFNKLIFKSNLISISGAKERNRFFNKLLMTIHDFKKRIV